MLPKTEFDEWAQLVFDRKAQEWRMWFIRSKTYATGIPYSFEVRLSFGDAYYVRDVGTIEQELCLRQWNRHNSIFYCGKKVTRVIHNPLVGLPQPRDQVFLSGDVLNLFKVTGTLDNDN